MEPMEARQASPTLSRTAEEAMPAEQQQHVRKRPRFSLPPSPSRSPQAIPAISATMMKVDPSKAENQYEELSDDELCTPERELEPMPDDDTVAGPVESDSRPDAPSPSPLVPFASMFNHSSLVASIVEGSSSSSHMTQGKAPVALGAASESPVAAAPLSSSTPSDLHLTHASTANAVHQIIAAPSGASALPQFDGSQKGKRWPAECEAALVRFAAQDVALRTWAADKFPSGTKFKQGVVSHSLARFRSLTQGPSEGAIYKKIIHWRATFIEFRNLLTPRAQSMRISEWNSPQDLAWLALYEKKSGAWIRIWHEELHLAVAHTSTPAPGQSLNLSSNPGSMTQVAAENTTHDTSLDESTQQASSSTLPSLPSPPSLALPSQAYKFASPDVQDPSLQPDYAASSSYLSLPNFAAAPSSSMPRRRIKASGYSRTTESALLAQQAGQIAALRVQSQQQSELMARQAELIRRQTIQNAQQGQQVSQLTQSMESFKQQLEELQALLRERT